MSLAQAVANPFDGVKYVPGYADTYPNVVIGGVSQPATWPDTVYAAKGEAIVVAQLVKPDAPAQNVVVLRVGGSGPREATVTAAPGGSDTITATANGTDYTVTFLASYTPTVGDRVRLLWQGRDGTVLNKVGVTPAPGGATGGGTAPPPAPKGSGTSNGVATDTGTWSSAYGWDNWAGGGGKVYQGGSAYGASNNGAWFYSGAFAELAGANITRLQFRIPARLSVGSYNTGQTLHLYAHTSPTKPGGDVNRTAGPFDVFVPAGFAGGYADIDPAAAAVLIAGGGISISGEPYMGFYGKPQDPASGQIKIDWNRS